MPLRTRDRAWMLIFGISAMAAIVSLAVSLDSGSVVDSRDGFNRRGVVEPNPSPGKEVGLEEVEQLTRQNSGPLLPEDGDFSARSVSRAWTDNYGSFGFQFPSGLMITFSVESRTEEEAEIAMKEMVEADIADFGSSAFSVEELRGTVALTHEAAEDGPASLSWREGDVLVQVIGYGGETLSQLRSLALSMTPTAAQD